MRLIEAVGLGFSGEIVEGTIEGFEDCSVVQMETERGWREIHVNDIKDYLN